MPSRLSDRKWPWLYERDGDLNPTWIFVTGYLILGVGAVVTVLLQRRATAIIAALSYLATVTVALLISALPRDKAKILARARLGEIAAGISQAATGDRIGGASTAWFDQSGVSEVYSDDPEA